MLDKLRVVPLQQKVSPRPERIKPNVTVSDFRKYTQKLVTPSPQAALRLQPQSPQTPRQRAIPQVVRAHVPPPLVSVRVPQHSPAVNQQPPSRPTVIPAAQVKMMPALPPMQRPVNAPGRREPRIVKTTYPPIRPGQNSGILALKGIGTGRVLVMIAAGPSVNEVHFEPIKANPMIDFMCINQPHQILWPTKFWAFCDHSQYRRNQNIWDEYNGVVINSTNVRARKANQYILSSRPGRGFALDVLGGYHIGRSSTYANMQVAYYMDYKKIFIFGVDMTEVNGILHYYGQNPDVPNDARKSRFADEAENYMWAATHLSEEIRNRFTFCSSYNPWPFLAHFPRLDQKEAVGKIKEYLDSAQK